MGIKRFSERTDFGPMVITGSGDDAGVSIPDGQFSVGKAGAGQESVFGEGDSYPVPVAYRFDQANLSGRVITGATDVASELQNDSANPISMFDGITVGKSLLFGSDVPFQGIKLKTITAGVMNNGDIITEYLADSTPTWTEIKFMATDANQPFNQYAKVLANHSGESEQIRGGFTPNVIVSRVPVTLTINGVGISKYWTVMRIGTAITTDPIIQQVKLHTNRHEINAGGEEEDFGIARKPVTILSNLEAWGDNSAASELVLYGTDVSVYRSDCEFADSATDKLATAIKIPIGLDTSIPLQLKVSWYAKANEDGDVRLKVNFVIDSDGDTLDGSIVSTALSEVITVTGATETKVLRTTAYLLDVSDALVGDTLAMRLWRNPTDTEDTYTNSIIIENAQLIAYFWR